MDPRRRPPRPSESGHPRLRAALLMSGVVLLIVVLAVASTYGAL